MKNDGATSIDEYIQQTRNIRNINMHCVKIKLCMRLQRETKWNSRHSQSLHYAHVEYFLLLKTAPDARKNRVHSQYALPVPVSSAKKRTCHLQWHWNYIHIRNINRNW